MRPYPKIYVAGHRGLVGSAIVRQLLVAGQPASHIITRTHAELDLTNQAAVQEFFTQEEPDQVYLAAAKVGGIHANNTYPADFIYQNLMIQANVIDAAFRNGVNKLLFLGSSCIYPRAVAQPMREDALLTGVLEPTNEPYAIAKIAGIKLCESYNRQYGESHGVNYRYRIAADYFSLLQLFSQPGFKAVYLPEVMVKMRLGGASNRSIGNIIRKSREDLDALRRSNVGAFGGLGALFWKNVSKLGQFRH